MSKRMGRPLGLTPHGAEIRRLRVGLGLTAPQVAAQIGFHPESIRRVERGGRIGDVFASRLAKALGVKVEDIATPPESAAALDANKAPVAEDDWGR